MLFGVAVGAFGWFFFKSGQAYVSEQPFAIRVAEPTDEQFQALLTRLQPFSQAMNEGRAATAEISAADLDTLIARVPQLAPLRGRVFVDIVQGQLVADLSLPGTDDQPAPYYINARTTLDASYASGKFTFALRQAVPLRGEAKEGILPWMLGRPEFLQGYSQVINREFNQFARGQSRDDPFLADILAKLRTAVIQDDHIVLTSVERPEPSPVATPANPE